MWWFNESFSSQEQDVKTLTEEEKQEQCDQFNTKQDNYKETCSYISVQEWLSKQQDQKSLQQAWLWEEILQVAELRPEYRQTLIDANPTISLTRKRDLLLRWLDILVKLEQQKIEKKFEALKQDYEILDYFPRKQDLWKDKKESWFWAILIEKNKVNSKGREGALGYWEKTLAIRWTEWLNDWRDLLEDGKMLIWSIPDKC